MSESSRRRRYIEGAPRAPEGRFALPSLLPGDGPLELDIGFGRGRSLFERAEAAPRSRIVGIEIKSKWAFKVQERIAQRGIANVQVLCGDAREILARAGPDGSVEKVSVHFPDPWWKKKHQKRMVVGQVLLDELARLMRPGGMLFIQTDVEDRALAYLAQLRAHQGFSLEGETGLASENPLRARSNREHRAIADGLPIWRIVARRKG